MRKYVFLFEYDCGVHWVWDVLINYLDVATDSLVAFYNGRSNI